MKEINIFRIFIQKSDAMRRKFHEEQGKANFKRINNSKVNGERQF